MNKNDQSPVPLNRGIGVGKIILYTTVFLLVGFLAYTYYQKQAGGGADFTRIPKEMQINYIPADYNFNFDDENAIAILSNPHRYHREFNDLIYKYNMSLLYHIANRMDLPDSIRVELEPEYRKHHEYLSQLYFNDFVALRDTGSNFYEAWYDNESSSVVQVMDEVASKYTCFLVNQVITTLLKTQEGKLWGKGSKVDTPCGIAMTEGLRPLIKRLQQTAAINDFSKSKGMIQEKVETLIAELATVEVRDKKGLNKQLQTKIWGYAVSSTNIEISAISIMKVGFRLNKYFNMTVDTKSKTVWVTLPEPEILTHEVHPKVDNMEVGWLRELSNDDLNQNFNILRAEFRREALESNVFDKSKGQATELMTMILEPVVKTIGNDYQVKVRFRKMTSEQPQNPEVFIPSAASAAKVNAPDN